MENKIEKQQWTAGEWEDEKQGNRILIGAKIEQIRKELGLSQKEFGDMVTIFKGGEETTLDKATISKIEHAKWGMGIDTLWAILESFGYEIKIEKKTPESVRTDADIINQWLYERQKELFEGEK